MLLDIRRNSRQEIIEYLTRFMPDDIDVWLVFGAEVFVGIIGNPNAGHIWLGNLNDVVMDLKAGKDLW